MSFEKELVKRQIQLTEDSTLPKGQRTVKNFKRCIAAIRAAEAASQDAQNEANEMCRAAQDKVILLQERVRILENELKHFKVKERLEAIESLTTNDRIRLLEATNNDRPSAAI